MSAQRLSDYQLKRYCRQIAYRPLGLQGQANLLAGSACVIGCGGLGCTITQLLARAGVGKLVICDPQTPELENLHRQILFDEENVQAADSKADAAGQKLSAINSHADIETHTLQVTADNICQLAGDCDVIVDATDNLATRYVINAAAVKLSKPWVYGGCVGGEGLVFTFLPHRGPCLVCLFGQDRPNDQLATCQATGVLNTLPVLIGALQANEATKILASREQQCSKKILKVDLWNNRITHVAPGPADPDCPVCSAT